MADGKKLEEMVDKILGVYKKGDMKSLKKFADTLEEKYDTNPDNNAYGKLLLNTLYFLDDYDGMKRVLQKAKEYGLSRPKAMNPGETTEDHLPDTEGVKKVQNLIDEVYGPITVETKEELYVSPAKQAPIKTIKKIVKPKVLKSDEGLKTKTVKRRAKKKGISTSFIIL